MSKKLQPVQIDEDTIIYIEANDDVEVSSVMVEGEEQTRGGQKGWMDKPAAQVAQNFQAIESTIRAYTKYTLNAFRDAALANVEKVTLEFGVNLSGEGGVPYIATGTVDCNLSITVECAFPERAKPAQPTAHAAVQSAVAQRPPTPQGQPMPRQPHPQELPNGFRSPQ
ncbi:CU044_2847 family protein [Thermocoleostomius sinensis]|uniref:CU044_2847 family protein n=1 Tax=Thermocoleostomius sinensis A174 TaxID=2016057 RepID=A0A9E8ZFL3_9CYAN|nr:CU044_2847 family protein [Thermocoleostomius sinensis]WAL62484.1 CU044_2847 family protein [Thermocoleostomius sinensis A174]